MAPFSVSNIWFDPSTQAEVDITYCNIEEMRKTSSQVIHSCRDINKMNVKCVKVSENPLSLKAAWLDGSFSRINHM